MKMMELPISFIWRTLSNNTFISASESTVVGSSSRIRARLLAVSETMSNTLVISTIWRIAKDMSRTFVLTLMSCRPMASSTLRALLFMAPQLMKPPLAKSFSRPR